MVIIETSIFTKQVQKLLTDEEYRLLQTELVKRPNLGSIIRKSKGLCKVRWSSKGHGKRGGSRVIYYWAVSQEQLLLLFMYPKNVQNDLTVEQIKILQKVVEEEYNG